MRAQGWALLTCVALFCWLDISEGVASRTLLASGPGYAISRPMFVLLGDSITEFGWEKSGKAGWATLLAQHYSRKADIINRGMAGWNTRWALQVLPTTLQQLIPAVDKDSAARSAASKVSCGAPWLPRLQLLVIWFGANDASKGDLAVPVAEYKTNLASMIKAANKAGVANILLITPPPVDEKARAQQSKDKKTPDRTNAQVIKYAQAAKEVGKQAKVPVLDMYALVKALPGSKEQAWFYDGLHPSPEGQQMVADNVKNALETWSQFKSLREASLPLQWPSYKNINVKSPKSTFDDLLKKQRVCTT